MAQLMIMKLDQGYLVQKSVLSKWEPLAALSNGRDLCEWIAEWSGAKVDIFDHYEPADPDAGKLTEADIDQLTDEINAEVAAQEPQDSDPEPEAAEVPDEPESAPEVIAEAEERQTIDKHAIALVQFLDKQGAAKKWVKASYSDIGAHLNVTPPTVQAVISHTKEKFPRLRVVRVMAGEARGNNFTFNQDIAEPDAPTPSTPTRNDNASPEDLVLKYLRERHEKSGQPEFVAAITSIVKATGLKVPAIVNATAQLSAKGIVRKVREEHGIAVWKFLEEVAA